MVLKEVSCLGLSHFIFVLQTAVRPDGTATTSSTTTSISILTVWQ